MENIAALLGNRLTPTVTNDKSLLRKTKKAQLPYLIQGLLIMIVPSSKELSRLNKKFENSDQEFLVFDVPLNPSQYTNNSKLQLITKAGYADVSLLRTLFYILRLFYNEVKLAERESREVRDSLYLTGKEVLKVFDLTDAGNNYKYLSKHIHHLSSTAFVASVEEKRNASELGFRQMKAKKDDAVYTSFKEDIEGIIRYEVATINEKSEDITLENVFNNKKYVVLKIKLNDFLLNELKDNHYRLIDLMILENKLKGDLAKLIYTYVIFHTQSSFSISIKKLCGYIAIKYSTDKARQKELKKSLRAALREIDKITNSTIKGSIDDNIIRFEFDRLVKNLPFPTKRDYGKCPQCKVGKIVTFRSKKNGNPYWFCDRGKDKCAFVTSKEPIPLYANA